ncbi:hypothetical protein Godav_007023 [Gossypium davidsonii]|uniref:pectinesterase n=1 Tax=Gossypium davidsonii TaxID=34287 RepID=A0A7J8S770_GOSDV|nr:hypothetical protein [Gossypium davidsonii]
MDGKRIEGNKVYALAMCVSILLFAPIVVSQPIPIDKSQVEAWFNDIIKPVKDRGTTLDPELVQAETEPRIIKVMQGGGGEFDTITKAIESVPSGNAKRQYGTVGRATLITESNYFVGANLSIVNFAVRLDGKMVGAQAVTLRVSGDRDLEGDPEMAVITAQARESSWEDTSYSIVHGRITGTAMDVFLGRAWKSSPRVVYSYTEMDEIVHPCGWSSNRQPERAEAVYYGEYKCTGKGANPATREKFMR